MALFLIRLSFYLVIGFLVLKDPALSPIIDDICLFLAKITVIILNIFDNTIVRHEFIIYRVSYGYAIEVTKACAGLSFILTLVAAIIAYPARWIERSKGIILVIVIIQGVNVIRIISLFYFKIVSNGRFFDMAHEQIWPYFMGVLSVILWGFWVLNQYLNKRSY